MIYLNKILGEQMVSDKTTATEDGELRNYELVLIISPEVEDERLGNTIENISQFITDKGGAVSEVEQWGKRKLAYPVKHFLEGNYVLTRFKVKPRFTSNLSANGSSTAPSFVFWSKARATNPSSASDTAATI